MRMLRDVASTRTVREGSVGLLILLGLGLFLGLFFWLRGVTIGRRSYKAVVEFTNVGGIQQGAAVRYRGFKVGNISAIRPGPNGVEVEVEISPSDLIIPRDVEIDANQSGLISEVSIDLTPRKPLPNGVVIAKPLDANCDSTLIICDGDRLQGEIGISVDRLIGATTRFASIYGDPRLYESINTTAKSASLAAAGVTRLTRDLSDLSKATKQQLGTLSTTANIVQQEVTRLSASTSKTVDKFGVTADQVRLTTAQANRLIVNLDNLLITNRTSLVTTLNNLSQTSVELRSAVGNLTPAINRVTQGQLIENLETLSANAAQASTSIRDITKTFSTSTNQLVLQQTLDSARVTFQNTQKITSDLDELTGDPKLRQNVRRLINGLSGLVSSTEQLQQQIRVAQTLDSAIASVNSSKLDLVLSSNDKAVPIMPSVDNSVFSIAEESDEEPTDSTKASSKLTKLLTQGAESLTTPLSEEPKQ